MTLGLLSRNIEQLTQSVNKLEMALNDLLEENEELRGRLGLDPKEPLDLGQVRLTKALQHQQDRALNQVSFEVVYKWYMV